MSQACAVGPYEGVLREVVHALKYDGRRSVARPLAALMAEQGKRLLSDADFLVPVPLHRARQRERGFNQADDLARALDLPVVPALRRVKRTRPQIELEAAQRHTNVGGAFAIGRSSRQAAQGRVIVLIDDVTTTGATLEACARVLKAAGAAQVRALTAARVVTAPR